MASITTDNFLRMWDQTVCEPLHSLRLKKAGDYVEKLYISYLSQIVVHEVINKFTLLFDSSWCKV